MEATGAELPRAQSVAGRVVLRQRLDAIRPRAMSPKALWVESGAALTASGSSVASPLTKSMRA
eukprot:77313-Prymnesium_polylepis.1